MVLLGDAFVKMCHPMLLLHYLVTQGGEKRE